MFKQVMRSAKIRVLMLLLASCFFANANGLEMPDVFSDNMILQRETTFPVWGASEGWDKSEYFVCGNNEKD